MKEQYPHLAYPMKRWFEFESFLQGRGIKLVPWQEIFARAFFTFSSGPGGGKTFLLKQLTDFDQSRIE